LHALADPVSPHLAARRARTHIDVPAIGDWARRAEIAIQHNTIHTWSIIETAGGALSPLSEQSTNLDLARALEPALWLLVAPDALGVLHDLRATLSALGAAARAPELVVLSASRMPDASTGTNASELERLGIVSPVAVLERNNAAAGAAVLAEALMRL
jgi:dethiobiotin synthetase